MWIVMVRQRTESHVNVWLSEVKRLKNGAMISTGRRTPRFTYDFLHSSLDNLVDRLRRAISFLVGESVIAVNEEMLLLAGEIGERLHDVLDLGSDPEIVGGGDELE